METTMRLTKEERYQLELAINRACASLDGVPLMEQAVKRLDRMPMVRVIKARREARR
jgi:hypothetical protein